MSEEPQVFVDTINEMPFMDEEFDFDAEIADVEDRGFIAWPDYVPLPLPGYEYDFAGMIAPYSKPACRLRHRIWYWLMSWWRKAVRPVRSLEDDGIPF